MALDGGFKDIKATVEERRQFQIFWNNGTELDKEVEIKLDSALNRKLTDDDAVQIALLSNRELQALYSDLGVAQADLVQAGLLTNPIFMEFPTSGRSRPVTTVCIAAFEDAFFVFDFAVAGEVSTILIGD